MFDTNIVKVKAGFVGQIIRNNKIIVWESEPFPTEMVPSEDKLRRFDDVGYDKAVKATEDKITEAVERLFQ